MTRKVAAAISMWLALGVVSGGVAQAQGPAPTGFGAPCAPGQYQTVGYLLVCSSSGTYRYALPEDIPPAAAGGYEQRPPWYPKLSDIFRATNPPACPLLGRVTFTSPPIRFGDLLTTVPQGAMTGDHVTPIDHETRRQAAGETTRAAHR